MKFFTKKIFTYCAANAIFISLLFAQDAHFSQYHSFPLLINPATTGWMDEQLRVSTNHRRQWENITVPFLTSGISLDASFLGGTLNGGILALHQSAGDANLQTFTLIATSAVVLPVGLFRHHHFSWGIECGIVQKSLDVSKLVFGNQYDNRGNFDTNIPSQETIRENTRTLPELGTGVLWYYDATEYGSRYLPYAGISVFHLTEPNESFLGGKSFLSRRFTFFGGTELLFGKNFFLAPQFLAMKQNAAMELNGTILSRYTVLDSNSVMFGISYRLNDAIVAMFGFQYAMYAISFSYDMTVSGLRTATNYSGGMEISFRYVWGKKRISRFPAIPFLRF
jgi:type IX secretion system PorP/SprF family membrane protein